jgi:hypothetical protein
MDAALPILACTAFDAESGTNARFQQVAGGRQAG